MSKRSSLRPRRGPARDLPSDSDAEGICEDVVLISGAKGDGPTEDKPDVFEPVAERPKNFATCSTDEVEIIGMDDQIEECVDDTRLPSEDQLGPDVRPKKIPRHHHKVEVHHDADDGLFDDITEEQESPRQPGVVIQTGQGRWEELNMDEASSGILPPNALGALRRASPGDAARDAAFELAYPPQMAPADHRYQQDAANPAEVIVDNLRRMPNSQERDVPDANVRAGTCRTGNAAVIDSQMEHGNRPFIHDSREEVMVVPVTEVYKVVDKAVQEAMRNMKRELQPRPTNELRFQGENDEEVPPPTPPEFVGRQANIQSMKRLSRPKSQAGARRTRDGSSSPSTSPDQQGSVRVIFGASRTDHSRTKLPPFTGKESWEVWINRFQDVAERRHWTNERKLDEIIPLLQGAAGDFVYGQLSSQVRRDYHLLTQELTYRFRKVETPKTYAVKFSHREQKVSETPQEFAADL